MKFQALPHANRTSIPTETFRSQENYHKVMADVDREHLIGNIVSHLKNANKDIQLRQARIFNKADQEYGQRVADGLDITL